jgi:hypothetical protein
MLAKLTFLTSSSPYYSQLRHDYGKYYYCSVSCVIASIGFTIDEVSNLSLTPFPFPVC